MRIDGGEPEGFVSDPNELEVSGITVLICKQIGDTLEKHYPGWLWAIQPDEFGGVLSIRAMRLSGEWGYVFRLADLQGDAKVVKQLVIRGGGEILERFGVPRGTYRYQDWKGTTKDIAGMALADISDRPLAQRRLQRDAALTTALQNGTVKLLVRDSVGPDGPRRDIALRREETP